MVAMAIALARPDSILELVAYAFGGMGSAFGPCLILSLYWRRFNCWGATAGVLAGTTVSSVWGFATGGPGGMWDLMVATPGFVAGLSAAVGATLLTPDPPPHVTALFDEVNSPPGTDVDETKA